MPCPNCQHENRPGAKFCDNCGHKLQNTCPNCGIVNRADARFCDNCGHNLAQPAPAKSDPAPRVPVPPQPAIPQALAAKLEDARAANSMLGERRVVTMLFCDVTGSTSAAEHLDPEEWREIINGAFNYMIAPVYRYEGTLARLMGDAILAFFGAPLAHEDDPQRAILAGLEIVRGIAPWWAQVKQRWGLDIGVRVGINTGLVVVGAVGSDLKMEYSALGDAINLAARMEQTAEPGTVQVSENTYKLAAPIFDWESLGPLTLKGKADPVQVYRPLRKKAAPGRLRGIQGLDAPLIGRASELSLLQTQLDQLRDGRGGIAFILGEAGLGKSRLIREAHAYWGAEAGGWLERRATSYDTAQAYGLVRAQVRMICGVEEGTEQILGRLETWGATLPEGTRAPALGVIARLLGVVEAPGGGNLEGEAFKKQLFMVMTELFQQQYAANPGVVVLDDVHWADAASTELLAHLFRLTESVPVLFLCATRPEREAAGWELLAKAEKEYPHRYTEIVLHPLAAAEGEALVGSLLTVSDLPASLRALILAKADGNPFFVEEIVRTLIDDGVLVREGEHWRVAQEIESIEIPDTVQSLLTARIDRLAEEARQVLQMASVIGRSFYYRVLQIICDAEAGLDEQLTQLQRLQMILEAARRPELEYIFRHALTQETAYQSILRSQRKQFHRRVGEAIEALFPAQRVEYAAMLAHHFEQAEEPGRALEYRRLAGDAAFALYAQAEAILHYGRALELAKGLSPAEHREAVLYLFHRRGRALELASRFDEALALYEEMVTWGGEAGEQQVVLDGLIAQALLRCTPTVLFNAEVGTPLIERALALAGEMGNRTAEAKVYWIKMHLHRMTGQTGAAENFGLRSLALSEELGLVEQAAYTRHDLGYVMAEMGRMEEGQRFFKQAVEFWRASGNLPMVADNLSGNVLNLHFTGQYEQVLADTAEAFRISQQTQNLWGQAFALMNLGFTMRDLGRYAEGLKNAEESGRLGRLSGFYVPLIFCPAQVAYIHSDLGAPARGAAIAREILAASENSPYPETRLLAVGALGQNLITLGELEGAAALYEKAIGAKELASIVQVFGGNLNVQLGNALHQYELALARSDAFFGMLGKRGLKALMPEAHLFRGEALAGLGRLEEAHEQLTLAYQVATQINQRRTLWKILGRLAKLEAARGEGALAAAHLAEARAVIEFIAGHAPDELRAGFLAQAEVRGILESGG